MCQLNGEMGGQLFASIDFGTEEIETKVMTQINPVEASSSEVLMTHKYYIKLASNEYPDDDYILSNNPLYSFVLDNVSGDYKKDGNKYIYQSQPFTGNKYTIYKLVTEPKELFTRASIANNNPYAPDKFFFQKSEKYYVLSKTVQAESGKTYFSLRDLFVEEYSYNIYKIPLEKIIRESVHTYAKEPYHNIIINDLDDYGLEQLSYRGDKVIYALRASTGHFVQLILQGQNASLEDCVNQNDFLFDSLTSETTNTNGTPVFFTPSSHSYSLSPGGATTQYTVAKIEYGADIGYRVVDLTYTGDLISSIGDSLTFVLDKVKTMLGDFEYFYDVYGHFVFQRKRTYVNTSWSQLTNNGDESFVDYANSDRKRFSFNFEGNRLISAIQNAPVLSNLRNDFVVWGKRKGVTGAEIPIHARYAIDKKPVFYKALDGTSYAVDASYAVEALELNKEQTNPNELYNEIMGFEQQYPLPSYLEKPVKRENGSWGPGWWDIRDWRNFYFLLTGEEPNGTMKWYSTNDENGCVPVSTLGSVISGSYNNNACVWLIDVNKNGYINLGHGCAVYNPNSGGRNCTYYESYLDAASGSVVTVQTDKTKNFKAPYSGCADTHTYLYFLNLIESYQYQGVYFYNPSFPDATYEELIEENVINSTHTVWLKQNKIKIVDWREIIYQMALDYFAAQECDKNPIHLKKYAYDENDVLYEVPNSDYVLNEPDHFLYEVGIRNQHYFPTGYTGYEQYYTDMEGFWRELYNPDYVPAEVYNMGQYYESIDSVPGSAYYTRSVKWKDMELTDYNIDYYVDIEKDDIKNQLDKLNNNIKLVNTYLRLLSNNAYDFGTEEDDTISDPTIAAEVNGMSSDEKQEKLNYFAVRREELIKLKRKYESFLVDTGYISEDPAEIVELEERKKRAYWNVNVFSNPEILNFWIDFLDSDTELAQFAIDMVGDKTKVINEDKATAIIFREIPDIILCDVLNSEGNAVDISRLRKEITAESGYTFVYLPKGFAQYLTISYRNLSVKNKIDELLYQFAYCIENITLTAIPVYYLQPNTRIYVQDSRTQINGEYIVSKISISLNYNGTMSISATKAPERLY